MYIFVEKLKWKASSCLAPLRALTCIWRDRVPVKQDPNPANIYMYIYIYIGWKEKTTATITISRMCILRSEEYVCKICHKNMCTRCSTIYTLLFTFVWCITYVSLPHTILKEKKKLKSWSQSTLWILYFVFMFTKMYKWICISKYLVKLFGLLFALDWLFFMYVYSVVITNVHINK